MIAKGDIPHSGPGTGSAGCLRTLRVLSLPLGRHVKGTLPRLIAGLSEDSGVGYLKDSQAWIALHTGIRGDIRKTCAHRYCHVFPSK